MYVGQTKQFLEVQSNKQHNIPTWRSQLYMGAKPPYPEESTGSSTVLPIHLVKESL